MNQSTQTLDYLIFNRGQKPNDFIAEQYEMPTLQKHLTQRLQLDFYVPDCPITINSDLSLTSPNWHNGDVIEHVGQPQSDFAYHLTIEGLDQLHLPVLNQTNQPVKPQTINLIITKAHHLSQPFNNPSRLVRLNASVANLTHLPELADHLNRMYQQTIIKFNLIIDVALLNQPFSHKDVSSLKTFFRQSFNPEHDNQYLTNTNADLGQFNQMLDSMHDQRVAKEFTNAIYQNLNKPVKGSLKLNTITHFYQPIPETKQARHHQNFYLTPKNPPKNPNPVSKPVSKQVSKQVSKPVTQPIANQKNAHPKNGSAIKQQVKEPPHYQSTTTVDHQPDKIPSASDKIPSASDKIPSASEIDNNEYNNNKSVSEVLQKHFRKRDTFNNSVVIEKPGKPIDKTN